MNSGVKCHCCPKIKASWQRGSRAAENRQQGAVLERAWARLQRMPPCRAHTSLVTGSLVRIPRQTCMGMFAFAVCSYNSPGSHSPGSLFNSFRFLHPLESPFQANEIPAYLSPLPQLLSVSRMLIQGGHRPPRGREDDPFVPVLNRPYVSNAGITKATHPCSLRRKMLCTPDIGPYWLFLGNWGRIRSCLSLLGINMTGLQSDFRRLDSSTQVCFTVCTPHLALHFKSH